MKKIDIVTRQFNEILNGFITKYPNLPDHIFREFSAGFETLSELINLIATDTLYPFTRFAAYGFASRCDYQPIEYDGATTDLTITLKTAMAKTLPIGYKVSGTSSITGKTIICELTAVGDSGGTNTINVAAKQQITRTNISIGTVDKSDPWQIFFLGEYKKIVVDSIVIRVNGVTWTKVLNFDNSTSTDKHFMVYTLSDGRSCIIFGDNVTGAKPTIGHNIVADFPITEGLLGKFSSGDITTNTGQDSDIASITNTASSGGNDAESVDSIVRNSKANVRLRDGIHSVDDAEVYAVSKSSLKAKIVKAHAIPGTGASLGTATIQIITNDLTLLSAGEKTTLDAEMKSKTPFGVFPIYSQDPDYKNVTIQGVVTVRAGFDAPTVRELVKFSQELASSPIDNYIIDYYNTYGINQTRINVINIIYPHSFTDAENDALDFIITEWVSLLHGKSGREYGDTLEVGDLYTIANEMFEYGVDVYSLTTPTTDQFPTADQIIKGAVTIT